MDKYTQLPLLTGWTGIQRDGHNNSNGDSSSVLNEMEKTQCLGCGQCDKFYYFTVIK